MLLLALLRGELVLGWVLFCVFLGSLFGGFPVIDWLVVLVVGCAWGFWLVVVLSSWWVLGLRRFGGSGFRV